MRQVERQVLLQVLDAKWREHLYEMDYLKEGIGLRAMGQRDPLTEYQREGYQLFEAMTDTIKEQSVQVLFRVEKRLVPADGGEAPAQPAPQRVAAGAPTSKAPSAFSCPQTGPSQNIWVCASGPAIRRPSWMRQGPPMPLHPTVAPMLSPSNLICALPEAGAAPSIETKRQVELARLASCPCPVAATQPA